MNKSYLIFLMIILSLCLSGCRKSNFGVNVVNEQNIEITAEDSIKGMFSAAAGIEVKENQKLYVEPALEKGEISIKITRFLTDVGADAKKVTESLVSENVLNINAAGNQKTEHDIEPGLYGISVEVVKNADGKINISIQ
ncbi:MAG: hypothetical protein IJI14_20985 [Anaerolineaceae bacterium]|nr:hypothetical protein [Anaerolineaceae bacterium]